MSENRRILDSLVRGLSTAYGMTAASNASEIIGNMADSLTEADANIDKELDIIKNASDVDSATGAYEKILASVNQAASDTIYAKSEYEKAVEVYDKALEKSEGVYIDKELSGEGHGFESIEEAALDASKKATEAASELDIMDRGSKVSIDYFYTAKAVSTYVPTKALDVMGAYQNNTGLVHTVDGKPVYIMRSEKCEGLTTVTYAEITEVRTPLAKLGYDEDTPIFEINDTVLDRANLEGNILVDSLTRVDQSDEESVSYLYFGYVDTNEISVDVTRKIKIGTDSANDEIIKQEAAQKLLNTANERYKDSDNDGYSILRTDIKTQVGYNYDIKYKKYTRHTANKETDEEYLSRDIKQAAIQLCKASDAFDSIRRKLEQARELINEIH